MNKLLAAVVVATFGWGSAACFAADVAKKTELTNAERIELRNRADKLVADRTATVVPQKKQELTQEERMELRSRAEKLMAQRAATAVPAKATVESHTKTKKQHLKSNETNTPKVQSTRPSA